jgi:hypothetical protein
MRTLVPMPMPMPMATREAQRTLRGAPSMRRSSLVFVAVLAVFLLLYRQQERPSPILVRASDLR